MNCLLNEYEKYFIFNREFTKSECFVEDFDFSSNIIIELMEDKEGEKFVKIFLNNKPVEFYEEKLTVFKADHFIEILDLHKDENFDYNCYEGE